MKCLSLVAMGLTLAGSVGCGPTETATSCPDPALGVVDEECGIWVSTSLGDDKNPGTRMAPMASLSAAVERAADEQRHVYACGELWTEPLLLPQNVFLYGGFDCADGWTYKGEAYRARLETGPGQVPLKTTGYGGFTYVTDFSIRASDAEEPGGSSIAVIITDISFATFLRTQIVAGDAADGLDGEEVEKIEGPATAGAAGNPGTDACSMTNGPGGAAVETACAEGDTSRGGKGGNGGALSATDGEAGSPAPPGEKDPTNPQDGDGGSGQTEADPCTAGEPGQDGAAGLSGHGITDRGRVSPDGYVGRDGEDGHPGLPGYGGGGGGASRGGAGACGAAMPGGAGGGSGGAGGCGGKGGKGGKAGGSSFAILVMGSYEIEIDSCQLWVGRGGNGGDGAPGQEGGAGGEPGPGGVGNGTAQAGCQGGKGGKGGKGGGGGGGNGGHNIHVAFSGIGYTGLWPGTTYGGSEWMGRGGLGGDPGNSSNGHEGVTNDQEFGYISMGFQQ